MSKALHTVVVAWFVMGATASQLLSAPPQPSPIQFEATDWPWWRGPQRNGIASADQDPPLQWSQTENVLWKAPVTGARSWLDHGRWRSGLSRDGG